jgi:hypothetical protein
VQWANDLADFYRKKKEKGFIVGVDEKPYSQGGEIKEEKPAREAYYIIRQQLP